MQYPTSTHLLWIATLSDSHISYPLLPEVLLLLSVVRVSHLLPIAEGLVLEDLEKSR